MTNADQANALKQSGWSFLIFKLRPLHPCSWLKLSQQWTGNNTYAIDPCQKKKTPANQTKPGWDSGVYVVCQSFAALSVVTAGCPTADQLIPQAQHLPRRLIVGRVVVLQATVLAEHPAVGILNRLRGIEFFNPQTHTYIFHLK